MGNKNSAKPEKKKTAKTQPRPAPGRKREDFSQAAAGIVREATERG